MEDRKSYSPICSAFRPLYRANNCAPRPAALVQFPVCAPRFHTCVNLCWVCSEVCNVATCMKSPGGDSHMKQKILTKKTIL